MSAAETLTESRATTRRALDLPGIATLAAGMALLTAALVEARQGWSGTAAIALLGAAAPITLRPSLASGSADLVLLDEEGRGSRKADRRIGSTNGDAIGRPHARDEARASRG